MRYRNTRDVELSFEIDRRYVVPPGGICDVPPALAYAIKAQGLPLEPIDAPPAAARPRRVVSPGTTSRVAARDADGDDPNEYDDSALDDDDAAAEEEARRRADRQAAHNANVPAVQQPISDDPAAAKAAAKAASKAAAKASADVEKLPPT